MDPIETEIITSMATIVLVILCIAIFIGYGAHAVFYTLVVIALLVGFYNTWMIATIEERKKLGASRARKGARKGRRSRS